MKFFLLILLGGLPSLTFADCTSLCHASEVKVNEKVIEIGSKYLYVREATNTNDAPEIDFWLKRCGLGTGYPYCSAFVANQFKDTFDKYNMKTPFPMYAGVAKFAEYCINRPLTFKVISTKKMNWGIDKPEIGDVVSWKHGSSAFTGFGYKGHAGLMISAEDNKLVNTLEANTNGGYGGDQSGTVQGDMTYGNEGVYKKRRSLGLTTDFPIMYFIRLNKRVYEYE
jgi:hypothetical protein